MAKPIPEKLYKEIEYNLHHMNAHAVAREAYFDTENSLDDITVRLSDMPKGKSGHGDPTAQKGIALADGKESAKWIGAINQTRCWFAGSKESDLLEGYYGKNISIKEMAEKMGVDRRTIQTLRDNIVYRCVMHAIEWGLFKVENTKND